MCLQLHELHDLELLHPTTTTNLTSQLTVSVKVHQHKFDCIGSKQTSLFLSLNTILLSLFLPIYLSLAVATAWDTTHAQQNTIVWRFVSLVREFNLKI